MYVKPDLHIFGSNSYHMWMIMCNFAIQGPCATTHVESGGFCRSRPGVEHPDIMFHFVPTQVIKYNR